jgi:tellurite resistance protein TerC
MFVGTKMLIVEWFKIPVLVSLGTVAAIILGSVIASLMIAPKPQAALENKG